jgi:hypothetical protein
MAETGVHVKAIIAIVSMLWAYFRHRKDVYIGGDMFWYYEEGSPQKRLAPDVFVAFGVTTAERRSWLMWEEQKVPEVVFEITSRSTRAEDLGKKRDCTNGWACKNTSCSTRWMSTCAHDCRASGWSTGYTRLSRPQAAKWLATSSD